jgi:hypothetical protein
MAKPSKRGEQIRSLILRTTAYNPRGVVSVVCGVFGITRQAVNRYVKQLVEEGHMVAKGNTRQREYFLNTLHEEKFTIPLSELEEDQLWRTRIVPVLGDLSANVRNIWHYVFTEIVNNAIDHSEGRTLEVRLKMNTAFLEIGVQDDGVGIFRKIKDECGLEDERHAVLELSKGKLTTDPDRHTGEGIFFSSRMVDEFAILSGDVHLSHEFADDQNWILELEQPRKGTLVFMNLANDSDRSEQDVFNEFASEEEDYGFTKTVVPVRLARHGAEKLTSRSQAKRLMTRVDRFTTVILDFRDVDSIGRAFADEVFRVFVRNNPGILILPVNADAAVTRMIEHAQSNGTSRPIEEPAEEQ